MDFHEQMFEFFDKDLYLLLMDINIHKETYVLSFSSSPYILGCRYTYYRSALAMNYIFLCKTCYYHIQIYYPGMLAATHEKLLKIEMLKKAFKKMEMLPFFAHG